MPIVDGTASVPDPPVLITAEADPVPVPMADAAVSISDILVPVSVAVDLPVPVDVSTDVQAPTNVIVDAWVLGHSVPPASPSAALAFSGSKPRLLGPSAVDFFPTL